MQLLETSLMIKDQTDCFSLAFLFKMNSNIPRGKSNSCDGKSILQRVNFSENARLESQSSYSV